MEDFIRIEWHMYDVRSVCPILTNDEAREVLHYLDHKHDAQIGVNWDVIGYAIEANYPEKLDMYHNMSDEEQQKAEKEFEDEYLSTRSG